MKPEKEAAHHKKLAGRRPCRSPQPCSMMAAVGCTGNLDWLNITVGSRVINGKKCEWFENSQSLRILSSQESQEPHGADSLPVLVPSSYSELMNHHTYRLAAPGSAPRPVFRLACNLSYFFPTPLVTFPLRFFLLDVVVPSLCFTGTSIFSV